MKRFFSQNAKRIQNCLNQLGKVNVIDNGGDSNFSVTVVSDKFINKNHLQRHRIVTGLLKQDGVMNDIHAISIKALDKQFYNVKIKQISQLIGWIYIDKLQCFEGKYLIIIQKSKKIKNSRNSSISNKNRKKSKIFPFKRRILINLKRKTKFYQKRIKLILIRFLIMKINYLFLLFAVTLQKGEIIEEVVYSGEPLTHDDIIQAMSCLRDTNFTKKVSPDAFQTQVRDVVEAGLDENVKHVELFDDGNVKFVFWRVEGRIHGNYYLKNAEGKWKLKKRTFDDIEDEHECFKVLPKGCKYEGEYNEYISKVCRGYTEPPKKIKKGLLTLSVQEGNPGQIQPLPENGSNDKPEKETDPEYMAGAFAECIRTHLNTFSVQLECAVKGIPMDHEWAEKQLDALAEHYRAEGRKNVQVDYDSLRVTFDQEGNEVLKRVEITADDYKVTPPRRP